MYGLYGVGMPVMGPFRFLTGLSRMVVLVAGALCRGYASRNGRFDEAGVADDSFRGAGTRARAGDGMVCPTIGAAAALGIAGGGPGL